MQTFCMKHFYVLMFTNVLMERNVWVMPSNFDIDTMCSSGHKQRNGYVNYTIIDL
jgi:hypothetical protein